MHLQELLTAPGLSETKPGAVVPELGRAPDAVGRADPGGNAAVPPAAARHAETVVGL